MGVIGLQSFMKSNRGLYERVSLAEIAEQYRNEMKSDPVMLVDISSVIEFLFDLKGNRVNVFGNLKKLKKNLETFINNCASLGVKVKIFSDGMKPDIKVKFFKEKLINDIKILKDLYRKQKYISSTFNKTSRQAIGSVSAAFKTACHYCSSNDKCEFRRSLYEADDDIINCAKLGCFAILTNDSDFIVAEGAQYCLSAEEMNLDFMTMYNYNRNKLMKFLGLSSSQLLIFGAFYNASIKNYLKGSSYWDFHNKNESYFKLAEKIKRFSVEEIFENSEGIKNALQMAFPQVSMFKKALQFLRGYANEKGLKLKFDEENWNKILLLAEERHKNGIAPKDILEIIVKKTFYMNVGTGNVYKPGYVTGLKPLREKLYGILFFEYPNSKILVKEVAGLCEKEGVCAKPVLYDVSFVRRFHPGLLQMWTADLNDPQIRVKVFCQVLNTNLSPDDIELEDIPRSLLFPLFIAFCLLWESKIKIEPFKIKVLLIHSVFALFSSAEEIGYNPTKYCIDVLDLSNWFLKIFDLLCLLNGVCGNPFNNSEILIENCFDAEILQYVYENMDEKTEFEKKWSPELWALCERLKLKLYHLGLKCGYDWPQELSL